MSREFFDCEIALIVVRRALAPRLEGCRSRKRGLSAEGSEGFRIRSRFSPSNILLFVGRLGDAPKIDAFGNLKVRFSTARKRFLRNYRKNTERAVSAGLYAPPPFALTGFGWLATLRPIGQEALLPASSVAWLFSLPRTHRTP